MHGVYLISLALPLPPVAQVGRVMQESNQIRVTVWGENLHEKQNKVVADLVSLRELR
jgi:hypothetical protein